MDADGRQGWLVYALTGSSFYLGRAAFARAVPVLLCSPLGGAVADRADRRLVVAAANGVVGVLACLLGILAWTNVVSVWHIVAIAFLMGAAFAFEQPCRQALVTDIVEEKDLVNAVGLNSLAFNTAAVIGPAIAGTMIVWVDEGAIFMLNGASYLAIVGATMLTRPGDARRPAVAGYSRTRLTGCATWRGHRSSSPCSA